MCEEQMAQLPKPGTKVKVESKSLWRVEGWPRETVDCFEGEVVPSFPWLGDDYLCITSDDPKIPVRSIKIARITRIIDEHGAATELKTGAPVERNSWTVKGTKGDTYVVTRGAGNWRCNCVAGGFGRQCKHVTEVKKRLETV